MGLPRKTINEDASITLNIPPPRPAIIQTVNQQQGKPDNFKSFYQSGIKSFAQSNTEKSDLLKKAADYIKQNEGVKNIMYKDSKGHWTIGIGHLVTPQEYTLFKNRKLTNEEVLNLFKKDMEKKLQLAKSYFGQAFNTFSPSLQIAILDGYFRGDLSGSPRTKELLRQGNFTAAAKEYLNNNEYRAAVASGSGVAKRMQRNAAIMAAEK